MMTPYTLSWRQRRLYTYRATLYSPRLLGDTGGDLEADDAGVNYTPRFTDVPCLYKSTPELDVPTIAGRYKELNLMTLESWYFPVGVDIADQWVIEMTGSDPKHPAHVYTGRFWIARDNPQTVVSQGARNTNFQMVYAVLSNLQGLSTNVGGIS